MEFMYFVFIACPEVVSVVVGLRSMCDVNCSSSITDFPLFVGAERIDNALVKVHFCHLKCVLKSFIVSNKL